MRAFKTILTIFLFAFFSIQSNADGYEYGLKIVTYPSLNDTFTGLALDAGKVIPAKNSAFTLKFELLNRRDNVFGCIFRAISDEGRNIDLMYTADRQDKRYPILVCGDKVTTVPAKIPFDEWIPVSITLDSRTGNISLNYNGTVVSINDEGTADASGFRICFGHCQFAGYVLKDVASVSIREISIHRNSKMIRHWTLSLHDEYQCLDEVRQSPAIAANPSWIIDKYITWNDIASLKYDYGTSIAVDADELVLTTDGSWIERFNITDGSITRVDGISGICPINAPGQLLARNGKLYAYNVDGPSFAEYDPGHRLWVGGDDSIPESNYWNKTSSWWPEENALVSFGGYGFYHYNNDLLIQHIDGSKPDIKLAISGIDPRYSSASAIVDGIMYIFSGRGNVSGKQELSPHNYYDLHAIDLATCKARKLWEMQEQPEEEFMPAGNMIYDSERKCFYVFTTLGGGCLISISPDKAGYETMSLPCGIIHPSQYKDLNLWRSADGKHLYGLIEQAQVDGKTTVDVLGMSYPPINVASLHQSVADATLPKHSSSAVLLHILVTCVLLAAALGFSLGKRARKKKISADAGHKPDVERPSYYNFDKGSICFFGGFCVKDGNGQDITSHFTPTLRALTTLLILHSAKEPSGIISNKLNRILWPYKPEDTANNNRNVYISKLRPILDEIGDIKITCQNRFWSMQFGPDVICDYMEVQKLLKAESSEENINHMLELLLKGMMLPNMEQDWIDEFKSEFSNTTIDFLSSQLYRGDLSEDVLISACDTIFQHDFLNEDALKTKCRILYKQGKAGLAKSAYDSFCKDYKESIGMEFGTPFKKIIAS